MQQGITDSTNRPRLRGSMNDNEYNARIFFSLSLSILCLLVSSDFFGGRGRGESCLEIIPTV